MNLSDKFDKRRKDCDGKAAPDEKDIILYEMSGDPRHVCFIPPDGEQQIFYYADIMGQKFAADGKSLSLLFRTATVTLSGNNLDKLFESFKTHTVKQVRCVDKRYLGTKEKAEAVVTEIIFKT